MWADSIKSPCISAEYRQQHPHFKQWLDVNFKLFNQLSDNFRLIESKMFVKFKNVLPLLPPQMELLCELWHGCTINSGLDDPVDFRTY